MEIFQRKACASTLPLKFSDNGALLGVIRCYLLQYNLIWGKCLSPVSITQIIQISFFFPSLFWTETLQAYMYKTCFTSLDFKPGASTEDVYAATPGAWQAALLIPWQLTNYKQSIAVYTKCKLTILHIGAYWCIYRGFWCTSSGKLIPITSFTFRALSNYSCLEQSFPSATNAEECKIRMHCIHIQKV